MKKKYLVLDIGTTTLELALAEVSSAAVCVLGKEKQLNPQAAFGADVLARIDACRKGHLDELRQVLLDALVPMVARLSGEGLPLLVTGNSTMLHIFCGISPVSMGSAPFTPVFTESRKLSGDAADLAVSEVTLLPAVSAFIGADVVCGLYACGFDAQKGPALLIDMGTNGEMVIDPGDGALVACSTACGPALELANMRYGSDVLHLAAKELAAGNIDETGRIQKENLLTQKDVRDVQNAKAAIRAGVETLLHGAGLSAEEFREKGGICYLAGGMGEYLEPADAIRTGLLPEAFLTCVRPVGNSALQGAVMSLGKKKAPELLSELSRRVHVIHLEKSHFFIDSFVDNMFFPED